MPNMLLVNLRAMAPDEREQALKQAEDWRNALEAIMEAGQLANETLGETMGLLNMFISEQMTPRERLEALKARAIDAIARYHDEAVERGFELERARCGALYDAAKAIL